MAYIWGETFSNIRHSGIVGLLSITVVVLTTIVLCILLIIANYIRTELSVLKQSPMVIVFLKDNLDDASRQKIQSEIESSIQVKSAQYISKEDALLKTRKMFAARKEILEGLEDFNPLPASFEIELKPEFLDKAKDLVEKLFRLPGVDDIQYAEKASRLVKKIEIGFIIVGSVLGIASIVIICFSIMLTTYIRRDEIRIMRLVGATGPFIRLPLLLQGIMQGIIGSAIGLAILYGLLYFLSYEVGQTPYLPLNQVGIIVGLGAFMGFIAGAVPLRRLIKL